MSSSMRLYATLAAGAGLSLALGACDLGPKKITQTGYRGTVTLEHIDGDPRENLPRVWEEFCAMLARVSQQNRRI